MRPTKTYSYSLIALSGLLLVVCQPPVSLFFAAYVALVPLFFAIEAGEGVRGRGRFLAGFYTGIVCYTGLVYWVVVAMNAYGGISGPLAVLTMLLLVLYMSLYVGCFTWSITYLKERFRVPLYVSAPAVWIVLEYLRGVLLTGFPWSFLAHSQYNFLPVAQIVSVTGSYFLSFLIVAVNCLAYCVLSEKRFPVAYGTAVIALVAACLAFGFYQLRLPIQGTVKTSIVQGNIRQDIKFDGAFKDKTVHRYMDLTLRNSKGTDLVIWPETAMPFLFLEDAASREVATVPLVLSNNLLLGTISRDREGHYYNTAYVIDGQGRLAGSYNKVHLVPFGEYTPLASYFPFLAEISAAVGDFRPGPGHDPVETSSGKIGTLICFEGVFPRLTAETVRRGAEVLVNITNDAWFGRSSAPYQHFAFYIFRAIETDRFVLRAANTGISAIIDPRGRTVARTGVFEETVLNGAFSPRQGKTIYVRYGDYFVALVFLFLVAVIVRAVLIARSAKKDVFSPDPSRTVSRSP
jgi:apolipoprotein N-acyltransferase